MKRFGKNVAIALLFAVLVVLSACGTGQDPVESQKPGGDDVDKEEHVCTYYEYPETFSDLTYMYEKDETRNILHNFDNMYQAEVVKTDDAEYPYLMYFMGWAAAETNPGYPGCDAIFLGRAKNLFEVEMYCGADEQGNAVWDTSFRTEERGDRTAAGKWVPVIAADEGKWYDNWHNGDPSVVLKDGVFYMAYSSYCSDIDGKFSWEEGDTDGDMSCIMGATSRDGIHWTKSEYPILIWDDEVGKNEPVTGNNRIPYPFNSGSKPFYGLYHRPSILYDEGKWKIWFDYIPGIVSNYKNQDGTYTVTTKNMSTGYAECEGDFMKHSDWVAVRAGTTPAILEFTNPDVIKVGSTYYAFGDPNIEFYGGYFSGIGDPSGWPKRQIVEAVSQNGLDWEVKGFLAPDTGIPAMHVPQAYYEDGHLYLYYATQIGRRYDNETHSGQYNYKYDNIRVMVKCLEEK